jgi:tRNA nucleotidyltransferase/poly(A) polymerase
LSAGRRPGLEAVAGKVTASDLIGRVRAALEKDDAGPAWVVGGAVRDAFLGLEVGDIDLAVPGDPEPIARRIAGELNGHAFELSAEFPTWRAADREGEWQVDVATFRGPEIYGDLARRDFTIGAVAVDLLSGEGLDPTGGLEDMADGVIRVVGPDSFPDDPLRLMRAARFAARFGWQIDAETLELGRALADRSREPAGERTLSELCQLMAARDPVAGLAAMEGLGLLETLLPEVGEMRGVIQGPNHHLDVYGHTVEVLEGVLRIESELDRFVGGNATAVAGLLQEPLADGVTRSTGLRLAALFHDCAKPATRKEADGFISFRGHDQAGAEAVMALFCRLKSSRRLAAYVADLTRNHLILGFMVPERPLVRGRVFDYLRQTEPNTIDLTLLTVADRLAARGSSSVAGQEMVAGHLALASEMIEEALAWRREGPPERFLPGGELASQIGIQPGPKLGRILDSLDRAVFCGEVGSAREAVDYARRLLDSA